MNYLKTKIREKEVALEALKQWYQAQSDSIESDIYDLKFRLKEEEEKIKSLTQTDLYYEELFKEIKEDIKKINISMNVNYYADEIICFSSVNDIYLGSDECTLTGHEADITVKYSDIISLNVEEYSYREGNEKSYKVILSDDRKIEFTVSEEY